MTTPSSTSQSSCVDSSGCMMLSFAPTMHVGDLKNTTGYSGIGEPVSFAVGEIESDRDELGRRGDTGSEPRATLDGRQPAHVELAQAGQRCGRQRFAVDVVDLPRQVAQNAVGVDHARLFAAGWAITYELHSTSFPDCSMRVETSSSAAGENFGRRFRWSCRHRTNRCCR